MAAEKEYTLTDHIEKSAKALDKKEQGLAKDLLETYSEKYKTKAAYTEFHGYKGGISRFHQELYTHADNEMQSLLENKETDKKDKEGLKVKALEALVLKGLGMLKGHERAKRWLDHYKDREKAGEFKGEGRALQVQALLSMGADVLGFNSEEGYKLLSDYADGVASGKVEGYKEYLGQIAENIKKNLYGYQQKVLANELMRDPIVHENAKAFIASETMKKHKHRVREFKALRLLDVTQHAEFHHRIGGMNGENIKEIIKSMGYEAIPEKQK